MNIYTKSTMFSFADYYHRTRSTDLSMDELWQNFTQYRKKPREIDDKKTINNSEMYDYISMIVCSAMDVQLIDFHRQSRKAEVMLAKHMVCYLSLRIGYQPKYLARLMKVSRSNINHRKNTAIKEAQTNRLFRTILDQMLDNLEKSQF